MILDQSNKILPFAFACSTDDRLLVFQDMTHDILSTDVSNIDDEDSLINKSIIQNSFRMENCSSKCIELK